MYSFISLIEFSTHKGVIVQIPPVGVNHTLSAISSLIGLESCTTIVMLRVEIETYLKTFPQTVFAVHYDDDVHRNANNRSS